jgi:hypothetical protein
MIYDHCKLNADGDLHGDTNEKVRLFNEIFVARLSVQLNNSVTLTSKGSLRLEFYVVFG